MKTYTFKAALKKLPDHKEYINWDLADKFPKSSYYKMEFFKFEKVMSNREVLDEYEKRGLVPDPVATVLYMAKYPEVWDKKKYIAIQMKDNIYCAFNRGFGARRDVRCDRYDVDWGDDWFGVGRKSLDTSPVRLDTGTLFDKKFGYTFYPINVEGNSKKAIAELVRPEFLRDIKSFLDQHYVSKDRVRELLQKKFPFDYAGPEVILVRDLLSLLDKDEKEKPKK